MARRRTCGYWNLHVSGEHLFNFWALRGSNFRPYRCVHPPRERKLQVRWPRSALLANKFSSSPWTNKIIRNFSMRLWVYNDHVSMFNFPSSTKLMENAVRAISISYNFLRIVYYTSKWWMLCARKALYDINIHHAKFHCPAHLLRELHGVHLHSLHCLRFFLLRIVIQYILQQCLRLFPLSRQPSLNISTVNNMNRMLNCVMLGPGSLKH